MSLCIFSCGYILGQVVLFVVLIALTGGSPNAAVRL